MPVDFWTSLVLGTSLAVANAIASYLLLRFARNQAYKTFIMIALGGMVLRLMVVLALIAVVLITERVSRTPFVAAFFATFAVATVVEVLAIIKRTPSSDPPAHKEG
ncbi:MAG: hypothetical protein R3284_01540 [Rubricoccaceae bacterium]|nr:hypothetical protein [Rubricoccaceae bacterium]